MAETRAGHSQRGRTEQSVFECTVCGTRQTTETVEYDYLGYAICPVCSYAHRP